jgi:tetratricopeptide (TPR) repeat protein
MLALARLLALFLLTALLVAPAHAQSEDEPDLLTPRMVGELTLDELFEKLPENAGSSSGQRIEAEILRRWEESGSDTADLLYSWAIEAMEGQNYPLALDLLDQTILLKPDFAEAWNKRATIYYLTDDYSASLADIRQTLALEPRHFGALSGLGIILEELDRSAEAVRVYERALQINPQLDSVRESLERLQKDIAGDEI